MATGGATAFRENAVYIGMGKQSAWGTPVAPTWFNLWLDGSDANPEANLQSERGGDTTPFKLFAWKAGQYEVVKVVEYVQPQLAGYALQALLGTGSDTFVAATVNTTLSAPVVVGATTCSVAADLGNTGSVAVAVSAAYGNASYEVVTLNKTTRTGAGPFVYTLAASATFQKAHSNSDTVVSAATHTFTRKPSTFDPYTIEVCWDTDNTSTKQRVLRYVDAVCTDLRISHATRSLLRFEHTWYAASVVKQAAASTQLYDQAKPFRFDQASGAWKINTLTTGNAATFKSFDLQLKNSTAADDFQTEGLTPNYFLPGNFDIGGSFSTVWTSWQEYEAAYFGANTGAGASDSALIGFEQLGVTWTADGVNSLALALPNVYYSAAKLAMRRDGKPVTQPVSFEAVQLGPVSATAPLTATLTNAYSTVY